MDKRQRFTLLGIAAAIAAVVVVIALVSGGGDDDANDQTTSQTGAAQTAPAGDSTGTAPDDTIQAKPPQPEPRQIEIEDGEPVGGVQKIDVKKDDRLAVQVSSDAPLPIHFHGYEIEKDAAPGEPGLFKLKADIDGVFEMEIESTKTKIAEITVEP
jgi:hypothetical protein